MKRVFVGVAFALVFGGALYAAEDTLIDFALLSADLPQEEGYPSLNKQTTVDFRNRPGIGTLTDDQRKAMKTSLAIESWLVDLNSSSQSTNNMTLSHTKEITSNQHGTVMGVRVHFPVNAYNGWAYIRPPFDIPAYDNSSPADDSGNLSSLQPEEGKSLYDTPTRFEKGYGVIKNVGTVKQIAVNVYGLNYAYTLNLLYEDGSGIIREVAMGNLNFDGWATLTWDNPDYLQDVRLRTQRIYPIYPTYAPYIKFIGFRIKRDAMQEGGDFIVYFKDVKVIYDRALLTPEDDGIPARDINDEKEWGIIQKREDDKRQSEQEHFGLDQLYRYQEAKKQASEKSFTDPEREQGGGGAAAE